ncbi:MAG: hypothetical protein MdMp014T_0682 [Treponematales bacterium]
MGGGGAVFALLCAAALGLTQCGPSSIIFGGSDPINLSSPLTIGATGGGWTYEEDELGGVFVIHDEAEVTVKGSTVNVALPPYNNASRIRIEAGAEATVTLQNVTIDLGQAYVMDVWDDPVGPRPNPIELERGASLTLVLAGTNTLTAGFGGAGIRAPVETTLTITGADEGAVLNVTGGVYGAGVGGGLYEDGGTITVSSGKIYAAGNWMSAGIGGGCEGAGGIISITGGYVEATGGDSGAGIGGGSGGAGGTIRINHPSGTSSGIAKSDLSGLYYEDVGRGATVGPGCWGSDTGSFNSVPRGWPGSNTDDGFTYVWWEGEVGE